jgi:hypothetical protein
MPDLFTPLAVGDLVLPNRIIMAPLTRSRATLERIPTPMMIEHYIQRASAGLIITEATNVVPQSIAWDRARADRGLGETRAGGARCGWTHRAAALARRPRRLRSLARPAARTLTLRGKRRS